MRTEFLNFIDAIVAGDTSAVAAQLARTPSLATTAYGRGVRAADAPSIFYEPIAHYMYGGDTALHMAAAAFCSDIAALLITNGAAVCAKNRRGAEPLHYASDTNHRDPRAQAATIAGLLSAGADANAIDRSGVAPLHRAVRTLSSAAVRALLDGGADIRMRNGSGSTPLFLATHKTGRGGSGKPEAVAERAVIEALLLERGARWDPTSS